MILPPVAMDMAIGDSVGGIGVSAGSDIVDDGVGVARGGRIGVGVGSCAQW